MRGKPHNEETRSAALAALLEGQSVSEVAKRYALPKTTVSRLRKSIASDELAQVGTKKRESLAELIEGHLQASLQAAQNIANQTNNADWLNKQDADKLGVFYGITTDKAIRILEAAEAANTENVHTDES